MKWADVNFVQGIWSKPTTKTGKPHMVPIPPPLVAMLQAMPRQMEWVFASRQYRTKQFAHVEKSTMYKHWKDIRQRAGLADVTVHDLRRTCASWLAISGENLAVIGKVLGHTGLQNTAIYARLNMAPVRTALDKHAGMLLGTMSGLAMHTPALVCLPENEEQASVTSKEELQEWPG